MGGTPVDVEDAYRQMVDTILYVSNTVRPDISFAVGAFSRNMQDPSTEHMNAAKHVVRYLSGTREAGMMYRKNAELNLTGYCDAGFAGDRDDRRSTSGFVFLNADGAMC